MHPCFIGCSAIYNKAHILLKLAFFEGMLITTFHAKNLNLNSSVTFFIQSMPLRKILATTKTNICETSVKLTELPLGLC